MQRMRARRYQSRFQAFKLSPCCKPCCSFLLNWAGLPCEAQGARHRRRVMGETEATLAGLAMCLAGDGYMSQSFSDVRAEERTGENWCATSSLFLWQR